MLDCGCRVLQAVACEDTDHRGACRDFVAPFDQTGDGGCAGGLAEDAFATAEQLVGLDDFGVGDGHEVAVAFSPGLQRVLLVDRVSDSDRRGDGVGLLDGVAEDQGG